MTEHQNILLQLMIRFLPLRQEGEIVYAERKLRNVAFIIAHVDHGKTTLVDEMLKQGGVYRENQRLLDRVMDSMTSVSAASRSLRTLAIRYGDTNINIIDTRATLTPGGEVERILKMVNGVILLVDAAEGPHAPDALRPFPCAGAGPSRHVVNKIDRPGPAYHPRGRGRSACAVDGSRRNARAA